MSPGTPGGRGAVSTGDTLMPPGIEAVTSASVVVWKRNKK